MLGEAQEVHMRQRKTAVGLAIMAALVLGATLVARSDDSAPPVEQRLAGFADRLRLALSTASVAAFSPTLGDARVQAVRLLALLREDGRDNVPGLVVQAALLGDWITSRPFDAETRRELLVAASDIQVFLGLAVEAAVQAEHDRGLSAAVLDLTRVYAFLLAAWGAPVDGVAVPGLVMLLQAFHVSLTT
jgi:hypothetical protein